MFWPQQESSRMHNYDRTANARHTFKIGDYPLTASRGGFVEVFAWLNN